MGSPILDERAILLAEDEPLVRMLVADLLQDEGFRVLEASNASEALVLLQARSDVLVLLTDVEMPGGMNGFELAWAVNERWPGISTIIMSGRQRPSTGDMPDGSVFVSKPCTGHKLVQQVRDAADRAGAMFARPVTASSKRTAGDGAVVMPAI